MAKPNVSKLTMKLFGIPYQFPKAVDPRITAVSSEIGNKFTQNILLESPVCTIIPGEPVYLPGESTEKKVSTATALIEGHMGNFSALTQVLQDNNDDNVRLYDFKNNYNDYIKYVNVLCRAGAVFLELDEKVNITGTSGGSTSFQKFDWRNYRWNSDAGLSITSRYSENKKNVASKSTNTSSGSGAMEFEMDSDDGTEGTLSEILTNYNYVQFYIDPDVSPSESINNAVGDSMLKSLVDNGSNVMKDIAFMANSGGIDTKTLNEFTDASLAAVQSTTSAILGDGNLGGAISRVINLGSGVLKGHNIIIPNIYQNSSYQKSYSVTVHLKSPYGSKLGYYLDIFVPMMHLLALAMPKQESANTFSSPFLVKAYVDGLFSCNLGIVESIQISKVTETLSVSGLPTEVDVMLNIVDMYSELSMTPSNEPLRFANNSSLIEFLATNCGLSLVTPNLKAKYGNIFNSFTQSFGDILPSIRGGIEEGILTKFADFSTLYN